MPVPERAADLEVSDAVFGDSDLFGQLRLEKERLEVVRAKNGVDTLEVDALVEKVAREMAEAK